MIGLWLSAVLAKRPAGVAGSMSGVALTVALLAALAQFLAGAGASMTSRAVSAVPIDWQVQLLPGTDPMVMRAELDKAAAVQTAHQVRYADIAGFEADTGGTHQATGPGTVVAFDAGYASDFPAELRLLSGNLDGVLIAQQTAANLHVTPGDRVTVNRIGLPPTSFQVSGVVDLPDADSLFQAVGLPAQAAPQAPPDNVVIMPQAEWLQAFGAQQATRPDTVRLQLHVRLARNGLSSDPISAFTYVSGAAKNLEARVAGQALVADNLGSRLDAVREDARYASLLFLFLGLPGVALALALTFTVTSSGVARRRMEQALLRIRGATPGITIVLFGAEAAFVTIGGIAIGLGAAALFGRLALGVNTGLTGSIVPALVVPLGLFAGFTAFLYPAWRDARQGTVSAARRAIRREGPSLWRRVWLDILLLAISGLLFWQSASTGYQIVLAPEGVAATAVDYKAFLAPALFWIGLVLLSVRLSDFLISRNGFLLRGIVRPVSGDLAAIVAAALSRQSRRLTVGIAMIALAISFATSTAIFNATYDRQARVDAELTNGSDVTIFGTGNNPAGTRLAALAALPEAADVAQMQHRFAYVGADLQDLYGIDPQSIGRVTSLSDGYFSGGDAAATLARLASTADGVLVSEETVQDFQLQEGDTINLRLLNLRDHQYHPVPFKFIGVAREFPTAPRDSFLVANAAYVASMTGSPAAEYVLMRAKADPAVLARQAAGVLAQEPSLKISDIGRAAELIGSSLTAVDLKGLTTVELAFALVMAAAAAGLLLAMGFVEGHRNFAILSAIGATPSQLASFLWSEGLVVLLGGLVFGSISGVATAWMLVKLLTGVFDPPPEALAVPAGYLAILFAILLICVVSAILLAARGGRGKEAEALRAI